MPGPAAPLVTLQAVNILCQSVRQVRLPLWLPRLALLLPLSAAAQGVPADALAAAQALVAQAAKALAPAGARIDVLPGAPDGRLRLAPCARIEPYLPPGTRPWGASRVGLRCVQGERPWNVSVAMTVRVFAPAPVPTAPLPAGAVIETTQLAQADVDWAAEASPVLPLADVLQGRVLARPVAAGRPLRAADLRPRQWFAAGDMVRIVAVGRGFSISGEGQALSAGIEGQTVRVRTDNGRILSGSPTGERRLEVTL